MNSDNQQENELNKKYIEQIKNLEDALNEKNKELSLFKDNETLISELTSNNDNNTNNNINIEQKIPLLQSIINF